MFIEIKPEIVLAVKKDAGTMSQRILGIKHGVSQATVHKIIKGKYGEKVKKEIKEKMFDIYQYENWIC